MNDLIPFKFENRQTRVIILGDEFWFVAKDVLRALDYPHTSNPARLCNHVPQEWIRVNQIHTNGGIRDVLCLSEQGLYFFLGRSNKEKALPYQKKVAGEIMPQIRKTGSYGIAGQRFKKIEAQLDQRLEKIEARLAVLSKEKELREENEKLRRSRTRPTPKEKQEIWELYRHGYTKAQIRREIFRGIGSISAILKAAEFMAGQPDLFDDETSASRGKGGAE